MRTKVSILFFFTTNTSRSKMLSLSDTLRDQGPKLRGIAAPFLLREEESILLFHFDYGEHRNRRQEEALLLTEEDLEIVSSAGYNPEFVTTTHRSWVLDWGEPTVVNDEAKVVKEIRENLELVNRSLTFNVFTDQTSDLLTQLRGLKHAWKPYRGQLQVALDCSAMEIFIASLYSAFFIPKMLLAREDLPEVNKNTVLFIDYDGLVIPFDDGSFLIPPYQVFTILSMKVENSWMIVRLSRRESLVGEPVTLPEKTVIWIKKKGELPLLKPNEIPHFNYLLTALHESYARLINRN